MAITSGQLAALEGNINETWQSYFKQRPDINAALFNMIYDEKAQFTDYLYGAPGRMQEWNGAVAYDSNQLTYSKQYRPAKYSTGIQVDRDIWEDKEFRLVKTWVKDIAYGVYKTLNYAGAQFFNDAFAGATYTTADGLSICNGSHLMSPDGDTQSNTYTYDLDYDNLETMQRAMEDLKDDRGDKQLIEGNMIIASPYWRITCKQLFGADKEAFQSNWTPNAYQDFSYAIHPLITGKKWFLVNRDLMQNGTGANWWMRRDPRKLERDFNADEGDFYTEKLSWKAVGRWVFGATNWTWIAGSNPS